AAAAAPLGVAPVPQGGERRVGDQQGEVGRRDDLPRTRAGAWRRLDHDGRRSAGRGVRAAFDARGGRAAEAEGRKETQSGSEERGGADEEKEGGREEEEERSEASDRRSA